MAPAGDAKAAYESAYFQLLRAREELDHLRRYQRYLDEELVRIEAFMAHTRDGAEVVPRKFRRLLDSSGPPVLEAVGKRRAIVLGEIDKVPGRISDQEAYVTEMEDEVSALRG